MTSSIASIEIDRSTKHEEMNSFDVDQRAVALEFTRINASTIPDIPSQGK